MQPQRKAYCKLRLSPSRYVLILEEVAMRRWEMEEDRQLSNGLWIHRTGGSSQEWQYRMRLQQLLGSLATA
jgi:hypothetical protein